MLREIINRPLVKRSRMCEACGEDFECQIGLGGCWCSKISLTEEARKSLSEQYQDCLCRNCLETPSERGRSRPQ